MILPTQDGFSICVLQRGTKTCSSKAFLASPTALSCTRSQSTARRSLSSLSGPILSFCGDANDIRGKPWSTPSSLRSLRFACDNPPCSHMKNAETRMIHGPKDGVRWCLIFLKHDWQTQSDGPVFATSVISGSDGEKQSVDAQGRCR